ncbi:hypothetical protein BKA70DRAFT_1235337 [Coprinopsis sp. MPI-PUGE-AT-0042]|nr:hypothetical protein BKA70DRAFT_1235337 [Coprinopsis sp. MPI-PUGE-AT-0042]
MGEESASEDEGGGGLGKAEHDHLDDYVLQRCGARWVADASASTDLRHNCAPSVPPLVIFGLGWYQSQLSATELKRTLTEMAVLMLRMFVWSTKGRRGHHGLIEKRNLLEPIKSNQYLTSHYWGLLMVQSTIGEPSRAPIRASWWGVFYRDLSNDVKCDTKPPSWCSEQRRNLIGFSDAKGSSARRALDKPSRNQLHRPSFGDPSVKVAVAEAVVSNVPTYIAHERALDARSGTLSVMFAVHERFINENSNDLFLPQRGQSLIGWQRYRIAKSQDEWLLVHDAVLLPPKGGLARGERSRVE